MDRQPSATAPTTIDAYIAGFAPQVQAVLQQVRAAIRAVVPDAQEGIKYGMPTFILDGKNLVHFAGYAHHIGFYPVPSAMAHFQAELAAYKQGKGSVQFPLDRPIPYDLITRMVIFRVEEHQARRAAKK